MKTLLATAALFALGVARADDAPKKDWPAAGTWTKSSEEGVTLTFDFKAKDQFLLTAEAGGAVLKATCKYSYDKDKQRVRAEVTKVESKGDFPESIEKGFVMTFKLVVAADRQSAKLSDYEADNADNARAVVEGKYKAKKAD